MDNYSLESMRFNPPKDWIDQAPYNTHFLGFIGLLQHIGKRESILEIGTYKGESTSIIAATGYYDKIYTCDITNHAKFDIFSTFDNIQSITGDSDTVIHSFDDNSLDVIYIDGSHEYEQVCRDIDNSLLKIKKGGFICGHDYQKDAWPEVYQAVTERFGELSDMGIDRLKFVDTSWCVKLGE